MKYALLPLIGVALLAYSCSSDPSGKTPISDTTDKPEADTSEVLKQATTIFYSMPSPLELTTLIKSTGGEFRKDLLHNPNKANDYHSLQKRSLILGLYGADLSYSSVYDQQQDAVKYLAAAKRVGEALGIHEAFSAELIERANANLGNRDSMLTIMTDMYWQTNSQLKEENRDQIALMVMAGGWAEAMWLGSSMLDLENPDPEMARLLTEQRFTAMQLNEMFNQFSDDASIAESQALFAPILERFLSLEMDEEETSVSQDETTGVSTIQGKKTIHYQPEDLKALKELTATLRSNIISS